jgi:hypothetical protein
MRRLEQRNAGMLPVRIGRAGLGLALHSLGCGGVVSTTPWDAGVTVADGSAEVGVAEGGAPDSAGSFACGTTTCLPGQLCVHPCCGGPAPPCIPTADSGPPCPQGWEYVYACPGYPNYGCQAPACTPAAPFCIDGAAQCSTACGCSAPTCGTCPPASGRDVQCLCA